MDKEREGKLLQFLSFLKVLLPLLNLTEGRQAVDPDRAVDELLASQGSSEGRSGPIMTEMVTRALYSLVQLAEDNVPKAAELLDKLVTQYVPFAKLLP